MTDDTSHTSIKTDWDDLRPDEKELAAIYAQLASLEHRFVSLAIGFFGTWGILIWSKLMGWI